MILQAEYLLIAQQFFFQVCCSYKRILNLSTATAAEEKLKRKFLRMKGHIKPLIYFQLRQRDRNSHFEVSWKYPWKRMEWEMRNVLFLRICRLLVNALLLPCCIWVTVIMWPCTSFWGQNASRQNWSGKRINLRCFLSLVLLWLY